jgi:hypothetical protein
MHDALEDGGCHPDLPTKIDVNAVAHASANRRAVPWRSDGYPHDI